MNISEININKKIDILYKRVNDGHIESKDEMTRLLKLGMLLDANVDRMIKQIVKKYPNVSYKYEEEFKDFSYEIMILSDKELIDKYKEIIQLVRNRKRYIYKIMSELRYATYLNEILPYKIKLKLIKAEIKFRNRED